MLFVQNPLVYHDTTDVSFVSALQVHIEAQIRCCPSPIVQEACLNDS